MLDFETLKAVVGFPEYDAGEAPLSVRPLITLPYLTLAQLESHH